MGTRARERVLDEGVGRKFSKDGYSVMEFCAVTWSTARECVLVEQYGKFDRCDVIAEMLSAAKA